LRIFILVAGIPPWANPPKITIGLFAGLLFHRYTVRFEVCAVAMRMATAFSAVFRPSR
jgi:hypothetical protein